MTRILIVDDNPAVRRYLRAILEQQESWKVCGEARTGAEALHQVLEATPEPASLQAKVTTTGWFVHAPETNGEPFTVAIAFSTGGFLSTLIPPIGPAIVQFWERSHTWRVPVTAF